MALRLIINNNWNMFVNCSCICFSIVLFYNNMLMLHAIIRYFLLATIFQPTNTTASCELDGFVDSHYFLFVLLL